MSAKRGSGGIRSAGSRAEPGSRGRRAPLRIQDLAARPKSSGPDVEALERFLSSLGVDPERDPEYSVTAALLAELLAERTAGLRSALPTISPLPYRERYAETVGMDGIRFYGLCPHHLVPYIGEACVRYRPKGSICGAGALARAVRELALTPRLQENLTQAIADTIERDLTPHGVAVRVTARHFCMELKGAGPDARLVTEARRGATGAARSLAQSTRRGRRR